MTNGYLQNGIIDAFREISFLSIKFLMEVKGLSNQEANDFIIKCKHRKGCTLTKSLFMFIISNTKEGERLIMSQNEFQQFMQVLESDYVSDTLKNPALYKGKVLASIVNFLTFTKAYNSCFSYIQNGWQQAEELLPIYYIAEQEKCDLSDSALACYKRFVQDGYFYHVTSTENLDSIFENGIISLNRQFHGTLYADCLKVNRCWKEVVKRQHDSSVLEDLIHIPNFDTLYPERFDSIYFGANLNELLECYGYNSELVNSFAENILDCCFCYVPLNRFSKKELREYIKMQLKDHFDIEDNEMACLIQFYNKYYEEKNAARYGLENKTILMIPQDKVKDCTDPSYISLMKNPDDFINNYLSSHNIEYQGALSPEGLIAVSVDENLKVKVKKKNKDK